MTYVLSNYFLAALSKFTRVTKYGHIWSYICVFNRFRQSYSIRMLIM